MYFIYDLHLQAVADRWKWIGTDVMFYACVDTYHTNSHACLLPSEFEHTDTFPLVLMVTTDVCLLITK